VVDPTNVVRFVDRQQQRNRVAGFVFGVIKKYGDDRGGQLAGLLAYYGFLSLFPLLLILFTVLGIVAGSHPDWITQVKESAASQLPVIGPTIENSIHQLHRDSAVGLAIGIVGLLWGSQGASQTAQFAMAQIWNIPEVHRPNYWSRLWRSYALIGLIGTFLILSTALTTVSSFIGGSAALARVIANLGAFVLNVGIYVTAFRILTPKSILSRQLVPGAIAGAACWTGLQIGGANLLNHQLRNVQGVYGLFGLVIGLLWWLALGAMVSIYAAELNVVWSRRLWPRSIVQPPFTAADEAVLNALAMQGERRPEQKLSVRFFPPPRNGQQPETRPEPSEAEPTGAAHATRGSEPSSGASERPDGGAGTP
jgi:YihY family inner membrane protein